MGRNKAQKCYHISVELGNFRENTWVDDCAQECISLGKNMALFCIYSCLDPSIGVKKYEIVFLVVRSESIKNRSVYIIFFSRTEGQIHNFFKLFFTSMIAGEYWDENSDALDINNP